MKIKIEGFVGSPCGSSHVCVPEGEYEVKGTLIYPDGEHHYIDIGIGVSVLIQPGDYTVIEEVTS